MALIDILLIILIILISIIIIGGIVLFILVVKTISDIKKLIKDAQDVSDNVKNKKFNEVIGNPMVRDKVAAILFSRFGIFAPVFSFIFFRIIRRKQSN
jgi:ABC-type Na+ efflux pump permease subunit